MSEVTELLRAIDGGDPRAAGELLPLVYGELRRLAAARLQREKPGQTLDPTGLVHEAFLRLVGEQRFDNRGHFFAAAAEGMRRILIDRARQRATGKRGGPRQRVPFEEALKVAEEHPEELLALDEALTELEEHDAEAAKLVKLRFFAGFTHQDAAEQMGVSRRAADRLWTLARAWLYQRLDDS